MTRSLSSSAAGIANGALTCRSRLLARLIRCAMVVSGTRNARAICSLLRPATARRVSATWDGGLSAGWQHSSSKVSESSRDDDVDVGRLGNEVFGRHAPREQLLAVCAGTVTAPLVDVAARGHSDQPALGALRDAIDRPLPGCSEQRLLDGVFGRIEVAVAPGQRREHVWRTVTPDLLETALGH